MKKSFFFQYAVAICFFALSAPLSAQEDTDSKGYNADGTYAYPTMTQNIPAFPTAMGFGKYATGGRGGHVVTVTTLEDDATNPPVGSLRWAVNQYKGEPITVVFNVSGWIILKDKLKVTHKGALPSLGKQLPVKELRSIRAE